MSLFVMLCYIVRLFLFCYTASIDCVGLGFAILDLSDWQVRRWHFEELAVAQQLPLRSLSREQTFTSNAMGETLFCRSIAQMMAYIEKVQIKTHSHTSPESLHKKSTPISHHLNWTFQSPRDWYLWKGPFLQFQLNCKLYPKSHIALSTKHFFCPKPTCVLQQHGHQLKQRSFFFQGVWCFRSQDGIYSDAAYHAGCAKVILGVWTGWFLFDRIRMKRRCAF